MSEVTLEQNLTAARDEHLVPGREIHLQELRGYPFAEVGLVTGTSQDNAVANIWNTTGVCDPAGGQFDALDAAALALENGAQRAWLNPVRYSMFDRLDIAEAGDDKTFGDITGTWTGAVGAASLAQITDLGNYDPGYAYSSGTFTFSSGSRVYVLDAPDGEVFILHSFTRQADPDLSEADLAHLPQRLDLPAGWGFRTETIDEDLVVSANPDNLAHYLQDNLHNAYLGSDVGRGFSQLIRPDPLR